MPPRQLLMIDVCVPYVEVLHLEGNRLEWLPAAVGDLARLEELVAADNLLTVLPPSIARLARLTRLDLARNKLRAGRVTAGDGAVVGVAGDAAGLAHVGGCAALTELRLEGNAGLHSVPAALGALRALKVLALDATAVAQVPAQVLTGCGALHTLSMHG